MSAPALTAKALSKITTGVMLQTSDLEEFNQLLLGNLRHHGFIQVIGVRCTAVYIFVYSDLKNCVWTATKKKAAC